MLDKYENQLDKLLTAILAHAPAGAPRSLQDFIRQFYAKMPLIDLKQLKPAEACEVAIANYEFARNRMPGAAKIDIRIPARGGGQRTLVQILTDDIPFLVDSVSAELARQGLSLFTMYHPIIAVERDGNGNIIRLSEESPLEESLMYFEVSALPDDTAADKLKIDLELVLKATQLAVADWRAIMQKAQHELDTLAQAPSSFDRDEILEVADFLRWLMDKNFVFLGYIEYDFEGKLEKTRIKTVPGSELGVFKLEDDFDLKPRGLEGLPQAMLYFARVPQLVEITKAARKSLVHRSVPMDYIGFKRFDRKGDVVGECRFLGLFTSAVYYQSAEHIPIIRRKIARTLARADFDPVSHDGKALKAILEFLPRDEVFQISEDDLFETSMGILSLEARPRVRLFVRRDVFERFVSCMIFVPRERFSTYMREQIQKILEQAFGGSITTFYTQLTDSPLARVHLIIKTNPGQLPDYDLAKIEAEIARVTTPWSDSLLEELVAKHTEEAADTLFPLYRDAFPKTYMNLYGAGNAVHDIDKIEQTQKTGRLSLELYQIKLDSGYVHLKLYSPRVQVPLSDVLPMLENMGFRVVDENPFLITPAGRDEVWIRDFRLTTTAGFPDLAAVKPLFEEALGKVWCGEMENDGFNALVLRAGLTWREVTLIRAYAKYLKQTGFPYSQQALEEALSTHPVTTREIFQLFYARFALGSRADTGDIVKRIEELLGEVTNLTEDRILRRFMEVINATLRTNYFQAAADGQEKSYISFKLDSAKVPELPLPRPYAEIFVYSLRVEGIHLRGGKVARGGLRWSDRREDFRTEVLGLMKAQQVKNAVIVPVGSKGGFVVKQPPAAREDLQAEGIECYKTYLRGLLDITDNIVGGKVIPPQDVVRHDGDDPYLVVAADKGTATFSDIANGVSKEYNFWLGDAFASGGSVGYDHKKMAITARGAWISVTRHFAEMGVDIAAADFTVIGIGDMSGDVFGNGMILSDHTRLVGAFNHMHIFLDPTPDAKKSFNERKRLFDLPRSTWKDYNTKLISKGGGIFERSAKSIPLSAEIKAALNVVIDSMTPDELIRAMLLAPVDLLWNGGIGTYVKAETETHDQVGDRTNNNVRINGRELRCKVVGEGGNLGFTQRGRIEYASNGGRINTDAIDNSAGVDCSDHEVNIKIALGHAVQSGKLTLAARDALLVSMTDEVARLVLRDNTLQTQAITVAQMQGIDSLESQARLMRQLERENLLDRTVEFLPSEKMLADMRAAKKSLTRPELAVLLAYSKLSLYRELLDSRLPDDPYFVSDLMRYFPHAMREGWQVEIEAHPLRREIIATVVTNSIINRTGITFLQRVMEDTGLDSAEVTAAYTMARDAFGLRSLWLDIEAVERTLAVETVAEMFAEIKRFLERVTLWFLRNAPLPLNITQLAAEFKPGIDELNAILSHTLSPAMEKAYGKKYTGLIAKQVPEPLAARIANLEALASACDIVKVDGTTPLSLPQVARVYFTLGGKLRLGWLRLCAERIKPESHYARLALATVVETLLTEQRRLTMAVVSVLCDDNECTTGVEKWFEEHKEEMERYCRFIDDLKAMEALDLPTLVVAVRNVKALESV